MFASARDVVIRASSEGVPTTELPVAHTSLRAPTLLRQALRQHAIDVLLVDKRRDLVHGALAVRGTGIALGMRFNFPRWEAPQDPLARLAYRRVDVTIFLTERAVSHAPSFMLRPPHVVIPEGIDVARFRPAPGEAAAFRSRFGIGSEPLLLGVGVLEPEKRYEVLIQAAARLGGDHVTVALAGAGSEREGLAAQARSLGVRLKLLGTLSPEDLPAAYSAATVFVHPSTMDTFGLSVAEAMACGCAVVVADAGSLPEVVGDAGLVVPADDPGAMAGILRGLLANESERVGLGHRARALAAERYTLEQMQRAHVEALSRAREARMDRTP